MPDIGYPRLFRVNKKEGGSCFSNPRFTVHQSYTMDEGAVLLVLWMGPFGSVWRLIYVVFSMTKLLWS